MQSRTLEGLNNIVGCAVNTAILDGMIEAPEDRLGRCGACKHYMARAKPRPMCTMHNLVVESPSEVGCGHFERVGDEASTRIYLM